MFHYLRPVVTTSVFAALIALCASPRSASDDAAQPSLTDTETLELAHACGEPQGLPLAACFAPGTPPEVIADVYAAMDQAAGGLRYFVGSRWPGNAGDPAVVTWSFIPDGTAIPPAITGESSGASNLFSSMDSKFGGNRALWISRIQSCFDRWQALSGITFQRVILSGEVDDGAAFPTSPGVPGVRGDIRIGAHVIDGGSNVLAYTYYPTTGDMVFDSAESWGSSASSHIFLRNVATHELGHGIGFAHVCPSNSTKLMEPFYTPSFDGPRHDDLRAVQRNYGDPNRVNDNYLQAAYVGAVNIGAPLSFGAVPAPAIGNSGLLSIDLAGEEDFYRFTVTAPRTCTVAVTPQGLSYDSSSQAGSGACNSGNIINSLNVANLRVQVLDTNGVTVLATADASGAGSVETLSGACLDSAGDYFVKVDASNSPTAAQLYTMTISVAGFAPVSITQQPTNQSACVGGSATLSLTATGAVSYQWRRNLVHIPGATGPSLTINPVALSDSAAYDCIAFGTCGSVTSNAAALQVGPPAITSNPSPAGACAGGSANFSVVATGAQPITYNWRKNAQSLGAPNSPTLTLNGISASDNGAAIDCVMTNACGNNTTASATLTVDAGPAIGTQPVDQSACVGGSAAFNLSASGTPPLSYNWRKNNASLGAPNAPTLLLSGLAIGDDGAVIDCVVGGPCGVTTSNAATVHVSAGPTIAQHPSNQTACAGASASFSIAATGSGLSYDWRKNGTSLGAPSAATLLLGAVQLADDGAQFDCTVTDSCGSITSTAATLSVRALVSLTQQPADQSVCDGASATFQVVASGAAPLSYDWRKNAVSLGAPDSPTLLLASVSSADNGAEIDCVVSNACGNATSSAATLSVGVGQPPTITQHPTPQVACIGESVTFTVAAGGTGLNYEWRKDGSPIGGAPNSPSYTIAAALAADSGVYSVRVFTGCGSAVSNDAGLTVPGVVGDLNGDATVDPSDLGILLGAWQLTAAGDLDGDGVTGNSDLGILLANWLRTCP
ncbi:MAG: matrixin family metalloprotease [Phycisphaerae bacterium]